MYPHCCDITALIRGLDRHELHATQSARMLAAGLAAYRKQFTDTADYQQAVVEELARLASHLPPYGPLLTVMNRALLALDQGIDPEPILGATLVRADTSQQVMEKIAGRLLRGKKVICTHTFSQTVSACLIRQWQAGQSFTVLLSESMPNRDGRHAQEVLSGIGIPCRVSLDADLDRLVHQSDVALLGCEAVLPAGQIIGKVGQSSLARRCHDHGIPVYIYAGLWKLLPPALTGCAAMIRPETFPHGYEELPVCLYDVTQREQVTAIITERGLYSPEGACALADQQVSPALLSLLFSS